MRGPVPLRLILLAALCMAVLPDAGAAAETRTRVDAPRPGPPHAWLFGAWTGGLFPVLADQVAQDCRSQQTVVFAQDAVAHGSLTQAELTERIIETVRTTPQGAEFRFTPQAGATGFGCADADGLSVLRGGPNTIEFPGCAAFPYPLERCPTQ